MGLWPTHWDENRSRELSFDGEGTHDIHTLILGQNLTGIEAYRTHPQSRKKSSQSFLCRLPPILLTMREVPPCPRQPRKRQMLSRSISRLGAAPEERRICFSCSPCLPWFLRSRVSPVR